jgi:hypothetical protein
VQIDQTIDLELEHEGVSLVVREIPVTGVVDVSRGYGYMGEGGTVDVDISVGLTVGDIEEILREEGLPADGAGSLLTEIRERAEQHFSCG